MRGLWVRIVLIALLVCVAAAAATLTAIERRHHVIFAGPLRSHVQYLPAEADVLARVDPLLGRRFLTGLPGGRFSHWMLALALPHEAAMAFSHSPSRDEIGLTVFLNERRFGPHISRSANDAIAQGAWPTVRWAPEGLALRERGVLLGTGRIPLHPAIRQAWAAEWSAAGRAEPLSLDGGNLVEIVLDNRRGGAFAVVGSLLMGDAPPGAEQGMDPAVIADALADIAYCRATAQAAGQDALSIAINIECRPSITEETKGVFRFFYEIAYQELRKSAVSHGASFEGNSEWQGTRLVGSYRLEGVSRLLFPRAPAI